MSGRNNPRHNITIAGYHGTGMNSTAQVVARRMRRQLVEFTEEVERRNRMNLYSIARLGRKPELADVETKLIDDLSYRREIVITLDSSSENYQEALDALQPISYLVMLDPPFEAIWQRMETDPAYAGLRSRLGRSGMYSAWKDCMARRDQADLLLTDPAQSILDNARLILHCFFT